MGIRITHGAGLDIRLEKIAEKSSRELRRVHREGAYAMAETASEMAPFKTGELEGSIDVLETVETGNRKTFTVQAEAPHAIYMEEGIYELGPGSKEKDARSQHRVGRKFMERSVQWLHMDWDFGRKLRNAVKRGKK